jgi:hypothetical protein
MHATSVSLTSALDTSQVKSLGLGGVGAVVLIGLIIAILVGRIVTKIVVLAIALVLGFALYSQRSQVLDAIDKQAKKCDITFFGVHVQPSDANVKKACAELAKRSNGSG